ncbi:hypothetical protein VHUM_03573 [Vanrija humicola]|uniref:VanZ-like domain-containing protein n=1 Tax=Vanrija humicola TaxID=5417 RepID=A0A7D8UZ47_VANHU|nr:hypothetical protein VHUM_03573 [Vanrija humicola]
MPSLPSYSLPSYPSPHAAVLSAFDKVEEYLLRSYPIKGVPLRLRPAMVFVVAAWLILLGVLGFAPLPTLPINDKALHFFGLGFATFLIYFVLEVPEGPHRRIWYIRRAPLILTVVCGFFVGGIVSEIVQSMLPLGDIAANLLGSTGFLYLAHVLDKRNRRRAELAQLYQPLSASAGASYRDAQGRTHAFAPATAGAAGGIALTDADIEAAHEYEHRTSNVWDDEVDDAELGNDVFALTDGDDERGEDLV